jgi:hypothetical protein
MVKRPDSNCRSAHNLALTAAHTAGRLSYARNTFRIRDAAEQSCLQGLHARLVWPSWKPAKLPNHYYPYARRWPRQRQQPRKYGWKNASYCTSTRISTVALRLGTLYPTDVLTGRARHARDFLDRRQSSIQVRHGTGWRAVVYDIACLSTPPRAAPSLSYREGIILVTILIVFMLSKRGTRVSTHALPRVPA